MTHTLILALNTFREAVRDRVLTAVLAFGGIFVLGAVVTAPLALGEHERVIRDLEYAMRPLRSLAPAPERPASPGAGWQRAALLPGPRTY